MAFVMSGLTATIFSVNAFQSQHVGAGVMMMSAVASGGLPSTGTATTLAVATQRGAHVFGFSSRSLMA
jgi:hypothetical protein